VHHRGRHHADGERTRQRLVRTQRPDFVLQRRHAPGLLDQGDAARGKARRALGAVDERNAQLLLQRLDVQADRRMAEPDRIPGGGEAALFSDGDEGAKLAEVHTVNNSHILSHKYSFPF
jgi:hypothetical protein